MIQVIWRFLTDISDFFWSNFDPWRDTIDILLVAAGIYWLLLLIRGTRAIQILVGLIVLIGLSLASELFQFAAVGLILEYFLSSAVLIIIVLFQHDIRRALARVGRGFFPSVSAQQESQMLEEVVRAAQTLSQRRVGALMVLERETSLADQMEAGTSLDAEVSKELLVALFMPASPIHDGAVVMVDGRIAAAGCILPLTLTTELPEGVGTRHRAAIGVTEETDAVVVVVSEETSEISVALAGEMVRGLDAPQLREVLRDILSGERRNLEVNTPPDRHLEIAEVARSSADAPRSAS
jgi:diadenylate cyclase